MVVNLEYGANVRHELTASCAIPFVDNDCCLVERGGAFQIPISWPNASLEPFQSASARTEIGSEALLAIRILSTCRSIRDLITLQWVSMWHAIKNFLESALFRLLCPCCDQFLGRDGRDLL